MRLTLILLLYLQVGSCLSQQKYWVFVNSNGLSNKTKVESLLQENSCLVKSYSKWLDAFVVTQCDFSTLPKNLVNKIQPVQKYQRAEVVNANEVKVGFALEQIRANSLFNAGLTGNKVAIGIIDGGFLKADQDPRLTHLFKNGQVKAYKDFVTPDLPDYGGSKYYGDDHGNQVWHMIAGKDPKTEVQFGIATGADFYLARTDDGRTDFRAEEDYLVAALEWMDSLGVKLVNISIGYSMGFENPLENYSPEDMDGKSVPLTRAAQIASEEKGMLLVIAGGNDGNVEDFRVVSTPADAKDALAVGATGYKTWQKIKYSSVGGEFLDYIKPDVACYSTDGTSFSAPIITGLAAAVWEKSPDLSNMEVKRLIIESGHLYKSPNNFLGYGVPNAERILRIMNGEQIDNKNFRQLASRKKVVIPIPNADLERIIIFHKVGTKNVIEQRIHKLTKSKFKLNKPENCTGSTVVLGENIVEVTWKN